MVKKKSVRPRIKRRVPDYDVQFGAFSEPRYARNLVAKLQDLRRPKGPNMRFRVVTKMHAGKKALFHVQFGAYQGWKAALNACNGFALQGRKCVVVRHRAANAVKNVLRASIKTPRRAPL